MNNVSEIAFICHPYHRGGVTRWMADAAIAYSARGLRVWFIAVDPVSEFHSAKGKETLLQLLRKEKNYVHILSTRVGAEFEFGTPAYRAWIYKQLIAKIPAGIPVILSDDHAVWEAAAFMHQAYPIVGVMHADEDHYYDLAAKYYQQVSVFACVSNRVKELTRKRVPEFPTSLVFTIPCGIKLPPATKVFTDNGKLQLVFVGRISEYQKRAGDLIKIAASLESKGIDFHLSIIGDGNLKPVMEQQIAGTELASKITFTGWLSQQEVAIRLSESDMLLLTSDFEGTPIAMMEAFAAGCGMVGTRVSGIEDYEFHPLSANCLGVYPVGDIEQAVQKIIAINEKPKQARAEAARQIAETEFSMDVCLDRYSDAIGQIKKSSGVAPKIEMGAMPLLQSRLLAMARNLKVTIGKK